MTKHLCTALSALIFLLCIPWLLLARRPAGVESAAAFDVWRQRLLARLMLVAMVVGLAFALLGCAGGPPSTSATPPSFNAQISIAERAVQLAQTSATAALRAGKISLAQDRLVQKQLGLIHDGLVLASSMNTTDPDKAAAQLQASLGQLAALQKQTGVTAP